jgi:hypothetical protein
LLGPIQKGAIAQQARLNTTGKNDGILRGWVDDQLIFEKSNVRMRDVDTLKIETVWLNLYYGGTWTAKSLPRLHRRRGNQQNTHRPVGGQPVNDSY